MPLGSGVSKPKANWAGFGEPDEAFWCCYGTGIESFAKLNDNVFFEVLLTVSVGLVVSVRLLRGAHTSGTALAC